MEPRVHDRRVVHLDPFEVSDDTLDALEREIRDQATDDLGEIASVDTIVLDSHSEGMDSHASIITPVTDDTPSDTDS